ncbi:MAG: DUF1822 family protein [Kovacikia sp.]
MDLESALKLTNGIVFAKAGRRLRDPELTLFEGTWLGLTYEQMAESSEYSTNYLMRDIGPKLWRLLSAALGEPVSKTNIRSVLEHIDPSILPTVKVGSLSKDTYGVGKSLPSTPAAVNKANFQEPVARPVPDLISYQGMSHVPKPSLSYGRAKELTALTQWILKENCHLVGVWGISGVGKTAFTRMLLDNLGGSFDITTWQSLSQSPTLQLLTQSLPEMLSGALAESQNSPGDLVSILLAKLQVCPSLLILDDFEEILQSGQTAGHFKEGYEPYGDFLQRIGEGYHQGCVIVVGLEPPRIFTQLEGETPRVCSIELSGFSAEDAESVLEEERLVRSSQWSTLIDYYRGHPAALRAAARMIRNIFGGSVDEFLKQESFIFEDINTLLGKSFRRLSVIEKEVLYWLASEGKPATLSTIQQRILLTISSMELLETLNSLKLRALLELSLSEGQVAFTLQPLIRDYVVNQFVAQVRSASPNQDWYYRWPLRSGGHALNLTPPAPKTVHLTEWFHNRFDLDWEPVEILFASLAKSSNRLRSAFYLRGEKIVKRFKQIQLKATSQLAPVVLLVAIDQETDATVNICVQVQPGKEESFLPADLKLGLLDSSEKTLAEVESQEEDNFIQLPYFRGGAQECFSVQLSLGAARHAEKFMI